MISSNMTYNESISTGDKVLQAFKDHRWVILTAEMQSGKTSIYTYVAEQMKEVDRVFVISGIADNYLKGQTYDRISHVATVYFLHDIIRKSRYPMSLLAEFSDSLIIIDESHIGATSMSIVSRFLHGLGISPNGDIDTGLYPTYGSPYILSVSATPYQECRAENRKYRIVHNPGPSYCGLKDLDIRHIGSDPRIQLKETLDTMAGRSEPSYAILRTNSRYHPYVEEVAKESGYPIIHCDMEHSRSIATTVRDKPKAFTIILIKLYARAGHTFSKRWVSMVWEILSRPDTQAQGLPGRCCGYEEAIDASGIAYNPGTKVRVYCGSDILTHKEWVKSGYDLSKVPKSKRGMYTIDKGAKAPSPIGAHSLVRHIDMIGKDIEDVIPLIYEPMPIAITHGEPDTEAIVATVRDKALSTLEWAYWLSPKVNELMPYIRDREAMRLPMYVPRDQGDYAYFILGMLGATKDKPITDRDIDASTLGLYLWPYRRSIGEYLRKEGHKIGINNDGSGYYIP